MPALGLGAVTFLTALGKLSPESWAAFVVGVVLPSPVRHIRATIDRK